MTKILIAIPSKDRSLEITKNTFSWLKYTKNDFKIFVEPQDYDDYCKTVGEENLVNLGENNRGLWFSKMNIKKYCENNDYKYIFKIDDDVNSLRDPRNRGLGKNAPKVSKQERCEVIFEPMIKTCLKVLQEMEEVGGISFKYASEMIKYDSNIDFDGVNKRFQSCYITRVELFSHYQQDKTFEDFTNFFHILKNGFVTLRYQKTGMDIVPVGSNRGGYTEF